MIKRGKINQAGDKILWGILNKNMFKSILKLKSKEYTSFAIRDNNFITMSENKHDDTKGKYKRYNLDLIKALKFLSLKVYPDTK